MITKSGNTVSGPLNEQRGTKRLWHSVRTFFLWRKCESKYVKNPDRSLEIRCLGRSIVGQF